MKSVLVMFALAAVLVMAACRDSVDFSNCAIIETSARTLEEAQVVQYGFRDRIGDLDEFGSYFFEKEGGTYVIYWQVRGGVAVSQLEGLEYSSFGGRVVRVEAALNGNDYSI